MSKTDLNGYIWVTLQLVGSPEDWRTAYEWYGSVYSTAKIAQREGEELLGHDDFVVAHVVNGRLVEWGCNWDPTELEEDRADAAEALGLDA